MNSGDFVGFAKVEPLFPYTAFADKETEQSIPERFEKIVCLRGERLAVRSEKALFSYDQLNRTANRLAHNILAIRGSGGEPVALLFEHDAGVLAAMMGVLKSGKFYVVLDPSYPKDRLTYMLADSGAELLITDSTNLPALAQLSDGSREIVNLDRLETALPDEDPGLAISPDALAMLLYTSGSTGQPKGVMHSHRNVLVEVRNLTNAWCISGDDRWLLYTSMSFANSVRTIYGGLLNGSAVFPYDLKRKGFGDLADWLNSNGITIMRSLPTTFRNFMETLEPEQRFPRMRILSVGGEPMPGSDVDYFNRHFCPPCVLAHGLGPTESFTISWHYVPHGARVEENKLPVGFSLPDKDVLLLDDDGREVPPGEVGEICVKSKHNALGYWRDSERSREVFRPAGNGVSMYRTGDLGVRSPNGSLTHVGRSDCQMKVRGYRIDATEIEAALRAIDGVCDAVVAGREDAGGELRLVAYFVPSHHPPITATNIRRHLVEVIPGYMIPSRFVAIAELPKTPNGKVDRLNLPSVPGVRPSLEIPFAPPATSTQRTLARIWSEVLRIDQVGIHDDFFELGGDSLVAARIISRVNRDLELELPIEAVFNAPTAAGLAMLVEQNHSK